MAAIPRLNARADSLTLTIDFLSQDRTEVVEQWIVQSDGLRSTDGLMPELESLANSPGSTPRYSLEVTERRVEWGASGESLEILLRTAADRAVEVGFTVAVNTFVSWLQRRTSARTHTMDDQSAERHAKIAVVLKDSSISTEDLTTKSMSNSETSATIVLWHEESRTRYTVTLRGIGGTVHQSRVKWERVD